VSIPAAGDEPDAGGEPDATADRIAYAETEEDCRRCNGEWGPHGILGIPSCVCPTTDGGKPCRGHTDCEHTCEVPWEDAVRLGRIQCDLDGTCPNGQQLPQGRCSAQFSSWGCRAWIHEVDTPDGPRLQPVCLCVD
jgi:hypothetical protein